MKNQDIFGVIANATQLLPKLHVATEVNYHSKPSAAESKEAIDKLMTQYSEIEAAQIAFIRNAAKTINRIKDVMLLFRDASYSFAGLGARCDVLIHRIVGEKNPSPKVQFEEGIRQNTGTWSTPLEVFNSLPGVPICEFQSVSLRSHDTPSALANEAFENSYSFDADSKALVSLLLMQYLDEINSNANMDIFAHTLHVCDFTHKITTPLWAGRALLGYFEPNDEEVSPFSGFYTQDVYRLKLNKTYIKVFADKLITMFTNTQSSDPDYFMIQNLRNTLYQLVIAFYFGSGSELYREYDLISRIVLMHNAGEINDEALFDAYSIYPGDSVLLKEHSVKGVTARLNKSGLKSFCVLVEALGLDDMPGFVQLSTILQTAA
jgi:hypothetical protein